MVESWAVTERVQDETGTSYCAKKGSCQRMMETFQKDTEVEQGCRIQA